MENLRKAREHLQKVHKWEGVDRILIELDVIITREQEDRHEFVKDYSELVKRYQQLSSKYERTNRMVDSIEEEIRILNDMHEKNMKFLADGLHTSLVFNLFTTVDNVRYIYEREEQEMPVWFFEKYSSIFCC